MADRTMDILQKHLDRDFRIMPMADTEVSRAQLDAIGKRHGVKYPDAFVDHVLGRFPGVFVEVKEAIWPPPDELDVGPFWTFLRAVHTFTPSPESEDWMRLDDAAAQLRERSGLVAAPVLKIEGDADVYCVDAKGALRRWRHETNALEPVDGDFWTVFDHEIGELRARKDRKKAEAR